MNPFLIAGALTGFGKTLFGIGQDDKADKLKRFTDVPEHLIENKRAAEALARRTMYPGQTQDQSAVDRNMATTMGTMTRNAKSSVDILNANAATSVRANNAQNEISRRLQQWKTKGMNDVMRANDQIARVEDANNREYWRTKAALRDAANKNIFSGLTDTLTAGAGMLSGDQFSNSFNPWGGFQNTPYGQNSPWSVYGGGFSMPS